MIIRAITPRRLKRPIANPECLLPAAEANVAFGTFRTSCFCQCPFHLRRLPAVCPCVRSGLAPSLSYEIGPPRSMLCQMPPSK
jgi:hypothetical protein